MEIWKISTMFSQKILRKDTSGKIAAEWRIILKTMLNNMLGRGLNSYISKYGPVASSSEHITDFLDGLKMGSDSWSQCRCSGPLDKWNLCSWAKPQTLKSFLWKCSRTIYKSIRDLFLAALKVLMLIFWVVTPCRLVFRYQSFSGKYFLSSWISPYAYMGLYKCAYSSRLLFFARAAYVLPWWCRQRIPLKRR